MIELKNLRSAPVGYLEESKMFPLDFEEFLLASKVQPELICDDAALPVFKEI